MNKSIWYDEVILPEYKSISGDIKTDVAIIGGGLAGILTAYFLKHKGIDCVLLEKKRICGGTTGNTTAKITYQHGLIYSEILKQSGKDIAKGYLNANIKAFDLYKKLCSDIECDYEIKDNFVYSEDREKLEKEMLALSDIGFSAELIDSPNIPLSSSGAVKFSNQAQFHPLKFINGIIKGLDIYENTFVTDIDKTTVITDKGNVKAKKVIITTHFPFIDKHGFYFIKLYQHRSYVIALKNCEIPDGMYVSDSKSGFSFRGYKDYLILGGGGHRTGKKGGNYGEIEKFIKENYKNAKIEYKWSAQDCISLDSMPYIGYYSKLTENLYTSTGFNKWGMTGAMVSAQILSDMISGKDNGYTEVFKTDRSILRPQLFVNGFESVTNILNPFGKRCPHLGCSLNWNKTEHSWDCPCHGSRFSEKGEILENPANRNLRL